MFVDDLPMWGYIGEVVGEDLIMGEMMDGGKTYLYTHLHFQLGYSDERIVTATMSTHDDRKVDITDATKPMPIQFTYSVEWEPSNVEWKDRFQMYHDNRFLPGSFEIHWLSIINSFVLVLLLTAFLTIIMMRVLKNDLSRYMNVDEDTVDEEEVRGFAGQEDALRCLVRFCVLNNDRFLCFCPFTSPFDALTVRMEVNPR